MRCGLQADLTVRMMRTMPDLYQPRGSVAIASYTARKGNGHWPATESAALTQLQRQIGGRGKGIFLQ